MSARLMGRMAVVTGAGSIAEGMSNGRAAAIAYAREGARVLAVDLNRESVEKTRDMVTAEGGVCQVFVGDMARAADVSAMVQACQTEFDGRIDILHNNIGILRMGGPVDLSEEDWDQVVGVNLKSLFLTCKFVIPVMEAQGGGVVTNIGSITGFRYTGLPVLAYATTKGAIPSFTRSIAMQYGPVGIRANCVHPGVIDTPMLRVSTEDAFGSLFGTADVQAMKARRAATIPLGRFGTPFDVAMTAVFLASDDAKYITGTEVVVDGGFTQRVGG